MSDIALKVENLTKEYRLGTIGHGTLREDMQSFFAKIRGKEDPNSLVTAKHNIESDEKHFLALDNLNFEIKKGDRVGIIGKNGAGKSTLLKVLSRITAPTKGNIYINGRVGSLLEVGTGFHPELTGRENIYLSGSIMGMKKLEIDRKLEEIIDFSGVEKFIDTPVKRYSSGMFVRLGFAVAAHLEPDILIVDEVLAVGDAEFQKKAIGKMQDVSNNQGRTVLFVSHNMASVQQLCNRGILLQNGKLIFDSTINKTIEKYMNDHSGSQSVYYGSELKSAEKNTMFHHVEYMKCSKISILENKGDNISTCKSSDDIDISIDFECLIEMDNFKAAVLVSDLDYPIVFLESFDSQTEFPRNIKPGKYIIQTKIPRNILGGKDFSISVHLIYQQVQHIDYKNLFGVSILFDRGHTNPDARNSAIACRPLANWVIQQN